jgi:hypothetical protein
MNTFSSWQHLLLLAAAGSVVMVIAGGVLAVWLAFGREDDDFWAGVERVEKPLI